MSDINRDKNNPYVYILMGNPIPLARAIPKYSQRKMWDSQKQDRFACGIQLVNQHKCRPLFEGAIRMDIDFYLPISKTSQKRALSLVGSPHIFTPDLSNLIKWVEDIASNGILYKDDCIISAITARKIYDIIPRTEFTLTEILK